MQVVGDLGEKREADVGHLLVGDNGKSLTDGGQVGSRKAFEAVVVQTKRSVEGLEGRHLKFTDETECQVGSPDQVGQSDSELLVVVGECERVGDVAELHRDLVDVAIVGNEDGLYLLDVDALEGAESRVLDVDLVGLGDLGGEANVLEVGKSVPLDRFNRLKLGEVDGIEAGQAIQRHLTVEGLKAVSAETLHVGVVADDQVARDLLDAIEGNIVSGAGGNSDGAREGGARGKGCRIASVLDRGGCRDGALSCYCLLADSSIGQCCASMAGQTYRRQSLPWREPAGRA